MGSLFSSKDYVLYRFEYPENLFQSLRAKLSPALRSEPLKVLDLGCGTGLVTESFLKLYPSPLEVHLIDPDPEMLEQARKQFSANTRVKSFQVASSEKIPFPNEFFDLVLIGSAWHWMNAEQAMGEIERVLKPQGFIFIFEYQFPKAIETAELNDWIRLRFNSEWKPATQTPRGSLKELTECWRKHSQFSQCEFRIVLQEMLHSTVELAGVIVSQSRFQHYEQAFPKSERASLRVQLERDLERFLKGSAARFSYSYEGFLFKKRV